MQWWQRRLVRWFGLSWWSWAGKRQDSSCRYRKLPHYQPVGLIANFMKHNHVIIVSNVPWTNNQSARGWCVWSRPSCRARQQRWTIEVRGTRRTPIWTFYRNSLINTQGGARRNWIQSLHQRSGTQRSPANLCSYQPGDGACPLRVNELFPNCVVTTSNYDTTWCKFY